MTNTESRKPEQSDALAEDGTTAATQQAFSKTGASDNKDAGPKTSRKRTKATKGKKVKSDHGSRDKGVTNPAVAQKAKRASAAA